ncbi:MAG: sulfite exporter TauE/SafE family protein, partial [Parvibaculum sedimenti]
MIPLADILTLGSGTLIGLTLGLIGGGGSILAVPLLVYVVGVTSPHVAIGTSAIAVAANALVGVALHARARSVKWPCALVFAGSGVIGAFLGARAGKAVGGEFLLFLFGLLMIAVGVTMLLRKGAGGDHDVRLNRVSAPALLPSLTGYGLGVGLLSGFFGIGGGFLIVPGLINATNMPIIFAVGSSLVSVAAFGLATASSYALAGLVDWHMAALLLAGGVV